MTNLPPRLHDLLNLDSYLSPFTQEINRRYGEFINSLNNIEQNVILYFVFFNTKNY